MVSIRANRLLQALPEPYRTQFMARLEAVTLPVSTVIYNPDQEPAYAHFMTSGITSVVTYMENGDGVEVGLIGNEGVVQAFHTLGSCRISTNGFIQVAGSALRMPYRQFKQEFLNGEQLRTVVLQYIQGQSLVINQIAACNRLHEVEERLARWLLMVRDRVGDVSFFLTQEYVADMIGARRTTVTLAAGNLQRAGLIEYRRGHIDILDADGLERAACECYPIVRDIISGLYSVNLAGAIQA